MKFKFLFVALVIAFMGVVMAPASQAQASPSMKYKKPRPSKVVAVQQVAHKNQYVIVLKNGHTWVVPKCKFEDSRNCWWDAGKRGNKVGHSFADLNGRVHRVAPTASIFYN